MSEQAVCPRCNGIYDTQVSHGKHVFEMGVKVHGLTDTFCSTTCAFLAANDLLRGLLTHGESYSYADLP